MAYVVLEKSSLAIPTSIFKNRELSVLEALTVHLRDDKGMTYAQIARLLNRDDRTIWTAYNRAMKKLGKIKTSTKKEKSKTK
ncbi:MAG: sigma-70 region 4 domain-containing protein [Nanoarchaeota archaeon]|nr:sigma-70 region 4 domain-containing protein [Nanoarchaeota archaeon]